MNIRRRTYKLLRYAAAFLILLSAFFVFNTTSRLIVRKQHRHAVKDTLRVAVSLTNEVHPNKSLVYLTGFQYDLLSDYTHSQDFPAEINFASSITCYGIEDLEDGNVDILVILPENIDSSDMHSIRFSIPIGDCVWAVRGDDTEILDNINSWLGWYTQSEEYASLRERFIKAYYSDYTETGNQVLSPYDGLIMKYSRRIGWDWRLLAAVIRHESNFSMSVVSRRHAVGLMQILPSTAKVYGVTDIYDPGENIRAGALHLAHLQKRILYLGVDSVNIVPLTIAAYNCGEKRIEDCLNFVWNEGCTSTDWKEITKVLPRIYDLEADELDSLDMKKFNPANTIQYVDNVLDTYQTYLELYPPTQP